MKAAIAFTALLVLVSSVLTVEARLNPDSNEVSEQEGHHDRRKLFTWSSISSNFWAYGNDEDGMSPVENGELHE